MVNITRYLCFCCYSKDFSKEPTITEVVDGISITGNDEGATVVGSGMPRKNVVEAICNYRSVDEKDISFKKGDRMEVLDDFDEDWINVLHIETREKGLVPRSHVVPEKSIELEDWYFGKIGRLEAENFLLEENEEVGSFLIRQSTKVPKDYCLSVKNHDNVSGYHVKHYRIIKFPDNGVGFSISEKFDTLGQLVKYYSSAANGLCHVLTKPCPKPEPKTFDIGPTNKDKWEVPRNGVTLLKCLNRGHFGEVHLGKWNGVDIAVKTLQTNNIMSKEDFLKEATIMKSLKHSAIVTLYAVCTTEDPIYIIQEYMPNGSLLDVLKRDRDVKKLKHSDLTYIAFQIADGMAYLEVKNLIHRDLAARNILMGKLNTAKIGDFGLAKIINEGIYTANNVPMPVKWTALEGLLYERYSVKSDVWSYGILLMELFTKGQVPYPGMTNNEVRIALQNGYRMEKPQEVSQEIYKIMLNCWHADPTQRHSFDSLKKYFSDYD